MRLSFLDERLLEYDIDEIVFEERSPFQKVLIVHSRSLGNMLVLDDLQSKSNTSRSTPSIYLYLIFRYI